MFYPNDGSQFDYPDQDKLIDALEKKKELKKELDELNQGLKGYV